MNNRRKSMDIRIYEIDPRFADHMEDQLFRKHFIREKHLQEVTIQFRAARKAQGLTQTELANAIHTTQSSIARFESGNRGISLSLASRIAEVLGLQIRLQ
jgi:UDP-N-acetylglucosamine 1-carboxyvinyltransferase